MVHKKPKHTRLSLTTRLDIPNTYMLFTVYLLNNAKSKCFRQKYLDRNKFPFIFKHNLLIQISQISLNGLVYGIVCHLTCRQFRNCKVPLNAKVSFWTVHNTADSNIGKINQYNEMGGSEYNKAYLAHCKQTPENL